MAARPTPLRLPGDHVRMTGQNKHLEYTTMTTDCAVRLIFRWCLLAVNVLFTQCAIALAAPGDLLRIFEDPAGKEGDGFGWSIAAVGTNVLIGAPAYGDAARQQGRAYLFDGTSGALLHTFENPYPSEEDRFGWSVAALGGDVLIGAYQEDPNAVENAGQAYVFDGQSGELLHTLSSPLPSTHAEFGASVASAGGNPFVGAYRTGDGAAFVFDRDTGELLHTLTSDSLESQLGSSVTSDGTILAAGARFDSEFGTRTGAIEVFDAASGLLLRKIANPTPEAEDWFGHSTSALNGLIAAGAPQDDLSGFNTGTAYLFQSATGSLLTTFVHPEPRNGDAFGQSVAMVGDNVLIGVPGADVSPAEPPILDAGLAYLFSGTTGAVILKLEQPVRSFSQFGWSVAPRGSDLLVGAPREARRGNIEVGRVYLFAGVPEPSGWQLASAAAVVLIAAIASGSLERITATKGTWRVAHGRIADARSDGYDYGSPSN